ncbi:MAG: alpha-galactosidase [Actinomycetota bacterium]|nr:alpha-galactosidase [Actinomycetota bacterium]
MIFPDSPTAEPSADCPRSYLVIDDAVKGAALPIVRLIGVTSVGDAAGAGLGGLDSVGLQAISGARRGSALLVEHSRSNFSRPSLRGHRLAVGATGGEADGHERNVAGRSWSTAFRLLEIEVDGAVLSLVADDALAQLALRTEVEALPGGALRARHVLTNTGGSPYLLEALEVAFPLPDTFGELLDFSGRPERERVPQRLPMRDGLFAAESRYGRPGLDAASILVAGESGFGFSAGAVVGVTLAASGNSSLSVQRDGANAPVISAGELLLPGEVVLTGGGSYTMPWVVMAASPHGLDGLASALHSWQRTLPAHPVVQPVTLNVWEAVYFRHELSTLTQIADLAAQIGIERFVLDDGWFRGRRDDRAGLGDWSVDEAVWPDGLTPLIDHVHRADMQFGLWFEPEMVNPDSDLYRAHPEWILQTPDRTPVLQRNQLVLDLTNDAVWTYLRDSIDAILTDNPIDYVKWDHNRDLLEAGSNANGGAPAAHLQYLAFYRLLDDLRRRHPTVAWESCASGGGRIDLGVIERIQRVWTSDNTDALARQQIQRWTAQLVAPEYLGAHVSAPRSHQTGRTFSLDFRAATAFFYSFGIEWDITEASEDELARLAGWCALHKQHRGLLHSGRTVRMQTNDPVVIANGVISADRSAAIVAHVQLDESAHNRGAVIRIPGLDRSRSYRLHWLSAVDNDRLSGADPLDPAGPTGGIPVTGAALADVGVWFPRRRPESIQLISINS